MAWYDPDARKVRCSTCRPVDAPQDPTVSATPTSIASPSILVVNPVGGSSALREAAPRCDPKFQKGAVGEYLLGNFLNKNLSAHEILLNDRSVPSSRGNIDHIVIASSGVWILDTKNWTGRVNLRNVAGHFDERRRLYADDEDRTEKIEALDKQVIPVATLIGDSSIDVTPALVLVDEDRTGISPARILTSKPQKYLGVWIIWPKALVKKIQAPGPLSPEAVAALAKRLDCAFPPR